VFFFFVLFFYFKATDVQGEKSICCKMNFQNYFFSPTLCVIHGQDSPCGASSAYPVGGHPMPGGSGGPWCGVACPRVPGSPLSAESPRWWGAHGQTPRGEALRAGTASFAGARRDPESQDRPSLWL